MIAVLDCMSRVILCKKFKHNTLILHYQIKYIKLTKYQFFGTFLHFGNSFLSNQVWKQFNDINKISLNMKCEIQSNMIKTEIISWNIFTSHLIWHFFYSQARTLSLREKKNRKWDTPTKMIEAFLSLFW